MVAPTVEQQLPALLGKGVARLRKTDENPARSSVIDVAVALSGHGADYASQAVRNICENYAEVREEITDFKFPRRGLRKCPLRTSGEPWNGRFSYRVATQSASAGKPQTCSCATWEAIWASSIFHILPVC